MMFLLTTALCLVSAKFVHGAYTNLALGKSTTSSSNIGSSWRCVDGDTGTSIFRDTCWESFRGDMHPFWVVDLEANYFLDHVRITNRGDCCGKENWKFFNNHCVKAMNWLHQNGERLHDLKIEVFADDPIEFPSTPSVLCAMYEGPMPTGATENISCTCLTRGRYLRIEGLNRLHDEDRLTMCEVETFEINSRHCIASTMRRIAGVRFGGDIYSVDVTSTLECANVCFLNSSCVGFNFSHDNLQCELRVGTAEASVVPGWSYYVWDRCV